MGGTKNSKPITETIEESQDEVKDRKAKPVNTMHLFGDEGSRVYCFDPAKMAVEPVNVTGEKTLEIRSYSGVVQVDPYSIYMCGGIDQELKNISDTCLLFNPVAKTVRRFASMQRFRYTFPLVHFRNRLYALGGRVYGGDQESLLSECEYFDFEEQAWVEVAPMNKKRCTSMAFVYKDCIWVFGGYTDYLKRSSTIERYNPKSDTWEIVEFKLYQGMEAGHVYSIAPDKLLIIGGKVLGGECSYVHELDLHAKTLKNRRPLIHQRVLSKACVVDGECMYVIGGNRDAITCEKYNFEEDKWDLVRIDGLNHIETWKCFSYSSYTVVVDHDSKRQDPIPSIEKCANTNYFFGTDDEPFLVEVDKKTFETRVGGCPIELRLKNYQSACRVDDKTIFLGGGINRELKKIFGTSYLLDLQTKKVTKCEDMSRLRYTFSSLCHNGFVYVFGGRHYGPDSVAVLSSCERMDLNTLKWKPIASLNEARCTTMQFIHNNKIYVAGGYFTNGERLRSLETYDIEKDCWYILGNL